MPKLLSPSDFDPVLRTIGRRPDGASVDELGRALKGAVPRRTLQRRLAMLVRQGRLTLEGQARGVRYRLPRAEWVAAEPEATYAAREPASAPITITISTSGESIRRSVRRSIPERRPVGYERSFLDRYRPNESAYLPKATRKKLHELGKSADAVHPAGTYARQIFDRLLIDLSWNSSRLEGNTYSLLETERLLKLGEAAEGKTARDAQMILNHKAAIEMLVEDAAEIGFNRHTILNLHALLADNLLPDPRAGGRVRTIAVGISGTVFHPLAVPQLVDECFNQILDTAAAIRDPFEQAFFAIVHLPYLQPFEDVNKRVSRLAANVPLIRENLCPLSFVDVPQQAYVDAILGVYELNRVELLRDVFVWAYERSCDRYSAVRRSLGEPDAFRLRYRTAIVATVAQVVREMMTRKSAAAFVKRNAAGLVEKPDRPRFIGIVDVELASLHEGNIARYRLRPQEYHRWKISWR
jgi:hypothetical protein